MKTDTSKRIIEYVGGRGQVTAKELVDYLSISPQAVFKQLRRLVDKKKLSKSGTPPKVYYHISEVLASREKIEIALDLKKVINEHFLVITPLGEAKDGFEGFVYWCNKFKLDVRKTALEYEKTIRKYAAHKIDGLIDGMGKMRSTFEKVYLDKLLYLDFYAIERFGKTKLGQYLLYAKQSQNRAQISALIKAIKPQIEHIVKKYDIDAVGFIPPTVKREVQFMKELQKQIRLKPKTISIVKVKTPIIVPQKTLNKLNDRIENAKKTIVVDDSGQYQNILLIDDAVGSGATLNETALQIKEKGICKGKIIALAITGSFKGFDVISEI
ncbi:MAG: Uncharacterized protein FD145_1590 [Candidatus Saganbacteria bacterium]|uniref:Uncharacterized protein n=1 Tax=Candidatus Saganbacteria bacterium TaxID=2575572 RepID=A0A833KZX5_UNCSA|nr:MAG: Uncharacterized protein FD145_1590 [Candidatus Saganbacteria bacterium]